MFAVGADNGLSMCKRAERPVFEAPTSPFRLFRVIRCTELDARKQSLSGSVAGLVACRWRSA